MKKKKINNISELLNLYKDDKNLIIRVDNDCTHVYTKQQDEEYERKMADDDYSLGDMERLFDGDGYGDVLELWELLFPLADVDGV